MTTFHEREQAFEAKFAHDQEFRFLVTARRNKLLAGWLADRLHLQAAERVGLMAAVLQVRDGTGHDELLLNHVMQVASQYRGGIRVNELEAALASCAVQARQQLLDMPFKPSAGS